MRKVFIALLIVPLFCFSQQDKPKSKIEELNSKSGILIKREFIEAGEIIGSYSAKIKIRVVKITDLKTNIVTTGLKFDIAEKSTSVFLDKDEIDGLLISMSKIKETVATPAPTNYTEFSFLSKSGLNASLFTSKETWRFAIDIDKYGRDGYVFFESSKSSEAIDNFINVINEAKKSL